MAFGDKRVSGTTTTRNIVSKDIKVVKPIPLEEYNSVDRKELRELVKENKDSLNGLLPDPDAIVKAKSKAMGLEMAQEKGRHQALKVMNSIRTLSPAIQRSFSSSGKDEEQAEYFVKIMDCISKMAIKTANKMGVAHNIENNKWIINVLERVFAESLTNEMIVKGDIGEKMAEEIFNIALERAQEKSDIQFKDMPMRTSVQLAIIKGMTPLLSEQEKFDFYRNRDSDIYILTKLIITSASEGVNEILDPVSREEDRVITFKVLVEEAGRLLAECWSAYAKKVKEALSEKSEKEIADLLSKRPDGFNISDLINNFENQFRRLKEISKLSK